MHGLATQYNPQQSGAGQRQSPSSSPIASPGVKVDRALNSWQRSPSVGSLSTNDDVYQTYRKATRPTVGRHTTSTQYVPNGAATTPAVDSATGTMRIYGSRAATQSAEDVSKRAELQVTPPLRPVIRKSSTDRQRPGVAVNSAGPVSPPVDHPGSPMSTDSSPTADRSATSRKSVIETVMKGGENIAPVDRGPSVEGGGSGEHPGDPSSGTPSSPTVSHATPTPSTVAGPVLSPIKLERNGQSRREDPDAVAARAAGRSPTPMAFETATKSTLKAKLRKALSFSSSTTIDESELKGRGRLFSQSNRSNDNLSIASTASSASMVLRKMSHGLSKKTKRTFNGIFSGSRTKASPAETRHSDTTITESGSATNGVSYVNAEVDSPSRTNSERPISAHLRNDSMSNLRQVQAQPSVAGSPTPPDPSERLIAEEVAPVDVDGHGSVAFPRLSEEIARPSSATTDGRRSSMHLERALPETDSPSGQAPRGRRARFHKGKAASISDLSVITTQARLLSSPESDPDIVATVVDRRPYRGRGILKRRAVSESVLPPQPRQDTERFNFDFAATGLDLELGAFVKGSDPPLSQQPPPVEIVVAPQNAEAQPRPSAAKGVGPAGALHFNPRVTIHDTYDALEYDRRGDVATCNRLTPVLAQRIKEELNAYKLEEMSVAEESKAFTQFFS